MDVRKKLVELLGTVSCHGPGESLGSCPDRKYGRCGEVANLSYCVIQNTANYLIAHGVTVQEWISVKDRLPEPETEVLILAQRKSYSFKAKSATTHRIVTTGMYEDGKRNTEDSEWWWYDHDFEYDEELDAYIIPEGWWEYKHYNGDDEHNHPIDDVVTHWMPLPQPPKGE